MAGFRVNHGDSNLDDAKLLRSTEHVSVLLLNMGDINRPPHFNGKQRLPSNSKIPTSTAFFRATWSGIPTT